MAPRHTTRDRLPGHRLAVIALGLFCVGLFVLFVAVRSGRESTIRSGVVVSLALVLASLAVGFPARQTAVGKVVVGLGLTALLLGTVAGGCLILMVGGWSNVH